ncbi:hypothetical protein BU23DRAFT_552317 [Bimuria novae-zelandiae CBS 107.79]|uniref:Ubiquitin-conjugating enzyme E2-binding protein n=1 Tax=Bimuria novae-zelandiae CBS 107.79 TaxID=1447943 RepID=A0A6A5VF88_9PLEO|nr:hypothetical protein BU23DRAFT_552317 [Bimuria novae-zelandiae CBS 107.79]
MSPPPSTLPASAYDDLGLSQEVVKIATTPKPTPSPIAAPNILQDAQEPEGRLAMNESSITLYAELLLHIRTVTLFASLRTVHTHETKARLDSDGHSVTVTHEGTSATIRLPVQVGAGGDAALSIPGDPPSKDLTLRLQMEEKEGTDLLGTLLSEEHKANIVPWDGASLNDGKAVGVHCKSCQEVIVPPGAIRQWRDLPNENWAEMMDFWHCHKPDEHHLHDHTQKDAISKKGYAASNRLQATEGISFVDLASFLLKDEDCKGIEASDTSLHCAHCKHILGTPDTAASGHRIWKWCIGISSAPTPAGNHEQPQPSAPESETIPSSAPSTPAPRAPASFAPQKWISARLLFLIENQNVRKFHVHSDAPSLHNESMPSFLLWAFTPDLFFSSSIDSREPTRAMKVFWKRQTWAPPEPGEPEKADEEEVEFPEELFEELGKALVESQELLPASARRFQGWEVGLLERFDVEDVRKRAGVHAGDDDEFALQQMALD